MGSSTFYSTVFALIDICIGMFVALFLFCLFLWQRKMYKNQLQELAQRSCFNLPTYGCMREGPDHAPRFKASVNFNGETFQSPSYSSTIRQAELAAAQAALTALSTTAPCNSLTARVLDETGVYKNLLQETAHRAGIKLPIYTTVRSGPGHVPVFTSTVDIAGFNFTAISAKTKKQAEKNAAIAAWSAFKTMANLVPWSQSSKETKGAEALDQVIVTSVLSSLRPKDESKPSRKSDQNQARRSTSTRGNRGNGSTFTKSLGSVSTLKPNNSPSLLPLPNRRTASKLIPRLDEHQRDEDKWLGGKFKGKEHILDDKRANSSVVSDSSRFGPIQMTGQWIYGEKTCRGIGYKNPHQRNAPSVQVRSVIPMCAAPPLLRCAMPSSSAANL